MRTRRRTSATAFQPHASRVGGCVFSSSLFLLFVFFFSEGFECSKPVKGLGGYCPSCVGALALNFVLPLCTWPFWFQAQKKSRTVKKRDKKRPREDRKERNTNSDVYILFWFCKGRQGSGPFGRGVGPEPALFLVGSCVLFVSVV